MKQHPTIRQPRFIDPLTQMRANADPHGEQAAYVREIHREFQRLTGKPGTLRQYHGAGVHNCTTAAYED